MTPIVTEVILSRALAEPHLAVSIAESVRLAMKYETKTLMRSLDWIVPGKPDTVHWFRTRNSLMLKASWKNGILIENGCIYIPQDMIPQSARHALTTKPLTDIIDLPFCQRYQVLDEGLIRNNSKYLILHAFRDERDWQSMVHTLHGIRLSTTLPGMEVKRAR